MSAEAIRPSGSDDAIVIVTPMYNDWDPAQIFLTELNVVAGELSAPISVVIINDGSVTLGGFNPGFLQQLGALESIEMINLVANVGHARAIAIGLSYVATEKEGAAVAVIDCDGEDRPTDLKHLLNAFSRDATTVFVADRTQRHEGLAFRLLYRCYRGLFRLLTGHTMSFGNFSLIPWPVLKRIVHLPELWNHLAGSLMRSRFDLVKLPLARGRRYAGRSQMSIVSLVQHGMRSIAVDLNRVLVRTLIGLSAIILLLVLGMSAVVLIRFMTGLAIPGWASTVFGLLAVLSVQLIVFALLLLFISIKNDTMTFTLPVRHYREYVDRIICLRPVSEALPRSAGQS